MSELVLMPHPGVCEHVTKMGRVSGKGKEPSKVPEPQFRKLPNIREQVQEEVPDLPKSEEFEKAEAEELNKPSPALPPPVIMPTEEPVRSQPEETRVPYVEMKLGRNMRAAPKGSLAAKHTQSTVNSQHLDSEPLLHSQAHHSNNIVEYYTNTHGSQLAQPQGTSITSRQYPTRSITSPQHPTQDLIEMLNRNNQTVLSHESHIVAQRQTTDTEQERVEAELRKLRETEELNKFQNDAKHQVAFVHERSDAGRPLEEETSVKKETEVAQVSNVAPPPPIASLYGSYRTQEDCMNLKPTDEVSTQPFTPHGTDSFSGRKSATSQSTTDFPEGVNIDIAVRKQETVEEVDDIPEDIQETADSENENKIKDDDFNF